MSKKSLTRQRRVHFQLEMNYSPFSIRNELQSSFTRASAKGLEKKYPCDEAAILSSYKNLSFFLSGQAFHDT